MAKTDILCVGFELPGDDFKYVPFNSAVSLLDADIVLFQATLQYTTDFHGSTYQGRPCLSQASSVETRKSLEHWRRELKQAFDAGKTVFVFLKEPIEVYAYTGAQERSGTGRSQKVIHGVDLVNSYTSLPVTFQWLTPATGEKVKLTNDGRILASYWKAMQEFSHYEVHYEHKGSTTLMVTKAGDRTVASLIRGKAGSVILLPPLDFTDEELRDYSTPYVPEWTKKAKKYGRALLTSLIEIHKAIRRGALRSPAPSWVSSEPYSLAGEAKVLTRVAEIERAMSSLAEQRRKCESELDIKSLPKCLLYETGKALEAAVIDALRTFGFTADNYVDDESEFDIVFESPEGRFLGEAEGRDNSAISIEKLQQLERNIQEDFAKAHVREYAKGLLFGNPYRLSEPRKRGLPFTKKAISAAHRSGIALVHTPHLFPLVKHLKTRRNAALQRKIREAFAKASGTLVSLPPVPQSRRKKASTEQKNRGDA